MESDGSESSSENGDGRFDIVLALELLVYLRSLALKNNSPKPATTDQATQTLSSPPISASCTQQHVEQSSLTQEVRRVQNAERAKCRLKVQNAVLLERVRSLELERIQKSH